MAASSSTDPLDGPRGAIFDDDDDPSVALARALQLEEDAATAAALAAEDARPAAPRAAGAGSAKIVAGAMPAADRLSSPAYKQVQHLGRGTAKRMAELLNLPSLTLRDLLRAADGPRAAEILQCIDAGQRDRVQASLVALRMDLLPG